MTYNAHRPLVSSVSALAFQLSGRISLDLQAQPGKALCIQGDAGWGGLVRQGKYQDRRFADALVEA